MLGCISSVDWKQRNGYIIEKGTNSTYYFGFNSLADKSLRVRVGQIVQFDLYKKNINEFVAVYIRAAYTNANTDGYLDATVIWFSTEKRYGFVSCSNVCDAFLHIDKLSKHGVDCVKSGQNLKVKIADSKYPGRKEVTDVILSNNHGYHYKKTSNFSMSKKVSSQQIKKCSSNDFTAIPCTSNSQKLHEVNSSQYKSTKSLLCSDSKHVSNLSNQQEKIQLPSKSSPRKLLSGAGDTTNTLGKSIQKHINGKQVPGLGSSLHNRNNADLSTPNKPNFNNYRSGSQRSPMTKHKNYKDIQPITNPEYAKVRQQIQQKENLLKTLNLGKLPDAGKRLHDQVKELKDKLKTMSIHDCAGDSSKSDVNTASSKKNPFSTFSLNNLKPIINYSLPYDTSLYNKNSPYPDKRIGCYGKKMSSNHLDILFKVTAEAIEKLHTSLSSCPSSCTEISDPDGLQVTLMPHQRQALSWLSWREKQSVSGGILADDMGLGKTLTMISLILSQHSTQENGMKKCEDADESKENVMHSCTNDSKANDESISQISDSKTIATISAKDRNVARNLKFLPCQSTLIVSPASLIYHWESEIRNRCRKGQLSIHLFHGSEREKDAEKLAEFDIVITTYDIVRRTNPKQTSTKDSTAAKPQKTSSAKKEDALFRINWRRIILDEAHQIKNFKSQTSIAVCLLQATSRWALSGTPIQNAEDDMYAMIKFLHCHPFNDLKVWKNQVGTKTDVGRERLKTLVSCFVLRREKNQQDSDGKPLVNLPKRTFITHKLKLNEIEEEVYKKLSEQSRSAFKNYVVLKNKTDFTPSDGNPYRRSYSSDKEKLSAASLLLQLLRMRQCCGHLHLLKESFDIGVLQNEKEEVAIEDLLDCLTLTHNVPENKFDSKEYLDDDKSSNFEISAPSSKIAFVIDKIISLGVASPLDKVVVVSQWTSMLRIVAHHLEKSKISYATIEGSVSARKRMELVDDFNRSPVKPKVMLLSLQAGGVGLNLIGGNHLFLLDMHWNPALEKQAFDRIYRVGQTKDVFVHKFVVENTVEEQIAKLQEEKLAIAESVLEGADVEKKVKLTLANMKMLFNI